MSMEMIENSKKIADVGKLSYFYKKEISHRIFLFETNFRGWKNSILGGPISKLSLFGTTHGILNIPTDTHRDDNPPWVAFRQLCVTLCARFEACLHYYGWF